MRMRSAVILLVSVMFVLPLSAGEGDFLMIPHMGGTLAINMHHVESVFFMDKADRQRFHLVWKGNPQGKTVEGADAVTLFAAARESWGDDFVWVSHMEGSLGIARHAITNVFRMEKDGQAVTVRINYGNESKTVTGDDAGAVWKTLAR